MAELAGCLDIVVDRPNVVSPRRGAEADLALLASSRWSVEDAVEVVLRRLSRSLRQPARLVMRARMVLDVLYDGRAIAAVARELRVTRDTVRLWVGRFEKSPCIEALADNCRTGRRPRITFHDEAAVLTLACQRPEDIGRLEGRMTQEILSEEMRKKGRRMSRSSVQRILWAAEVRPHREIYYLFTHKDHPEYIPRRDAICDIYTRSLPSDEVVVCFDEKTGMQVLGIPAKTPLGGRQAPGLGQPARLEQHYVRHGSRTLAAAVRPDTGRLVAAEIYPSGGYKTAQSIAFLMAVRRALPEARVIHLVMDNGPTHRSAEMRAFLATEDGSVFHVLYTPTHASWLDLAENFLSRFSRRYLHGKRWRSLDHFDADMQACFVAYQEVAKPIRWRYNPKEGTDSRARRKRTRRVSQPTPALRQPPAAGAPKG